MVPETRDSGPPQSLQEGRPHLSLMNSFFSEYFIVFLCLCLFKIRYIQKKYELWVNTSQVHLKMKKLSEETEQNSSKLKLHWNNNTLGSPSLSNPFRSISVRCHSHIQVPTRNVPWTFMGRYLNYMFVFVCGNLIIIWKLNKTEGELHHCYTTLSF